MNSLSKIQEYINNDIYRESKGKLVEVFNFDQFPQAKFINNCLYKDGFIVLNIKNKNLLSTVRDLQKILGKQIRDVGKGKKYIAKVEYTKNGKFYINTALSQPLHTDEGYRHQFPRFVSLLCVKSSLNGGVSTIVKANELLAGLYSTFKNDVKNLFTPDFVKISSVSEKINKKILFSLHDDFIGISYSPILRGLETTERGYEMITYINQFIHNPINQYRILLKKNDLLIMDNCRVLHGRTSFNEGDNRLLLRLWNDQFKP